MDNVSPLDARGVAGHGGCMLLARVVALVTYRWRVRRAALIDQLAERLDMDAEFHAADVLRGIAAQTRLT